MCGLIKQYGPLVARFLLSSIFIIAGIQKANAFGSTSAYLANQGLIITDVLLVLIIIIELGGGVLILVGLQARFAAMVIFMYLIPETLFFHSYWTFEGQELINHFHHFFKNIAIMGGMIYVMVHGSGPLSLESKFKKIE